MEQQKLTLKRELLGLDHDLIQLQRAYNYKEEYFQKELISQEEYLKSKEDYLLAQNLKKLSLEQQEQNSVFRKTQIEKIKQNLENMERNLALIYQRQEHLIVRAPVDGQLASLNARPGEAILPGQRLGQVNDLGDFKIQASIDEHYIDRVQLGLSAQLESQNKLFQLQISKVYPEVNEGQFLVDLSFKDTLPDKVRSGQSHSLSLQLGDTKQALLIKRGGFFQASGGQWLYLLDADEKGAHKVRIRLGRQNPKYYEVLEGLQSGDKIISSSYSLFEENDNLILE
jgi:HlyD family secretion protein